MDKLDIYIAIKQQFSYCDTYVDMELKLQEINELIRLCYETEISKKEDIETWNKLRN